MATGPTQTIDLTETSAPADVFLGQHLGVALEQAAPQDTSLHRRSENLLIDHGTLLTDGRGMLMQYGLSEGGEFIDLKDPLHPKENEVVTLKFDAGHNGPRHVFAWELNRAEAGKGQVVHRIVGDLAQRLEFNHQGTLVRVTRLNEQESAALIDEIVIILESDECRSYFAYVAERKEMAETKLADTALDAVVKGFARKKVKTELEKGEQAMVRSGFSVIPPIELHTSSYNTWDNAAKDAFLEKMAALREANAQNTRKRVTDVGDIVIEQTIKIESVNDATDSDQEQQDTQGVLINA